MIFCGLDRLKSEWTTTLGKLKKYWEWAKKNLWRMHALTHESHKVQDSKLSVSIKS